MEDIKIYKKSILLRKKKILTKLTELLKEEAECVDASLVLWIWSLTKTLAQHNIVLSKRFRQNWLQIYKTRLERKVLQTHQTDVL